MKTLKERLSDWTEEDIAEYHLAVVLGYFEDVEGQPSGLWNGHKGTIWSDTPVGAALRTCLEGMVYASVLLYDDKKDAYRWNSGLSESNQTIPMEKS